jgi:hypothetical protein
MQGAGTIEWEGMSMIYRMQKAKDELTAGDELVNTKLMYPSFAACKTKLALIPK